MQSTLYDSLLIRTNLKNAQFLREVLTKLKLLITIIFIVACSSVNQAARATV